MAMPSWFSGVSQIFNEGQPQVPSADWLSIAMAESGGNPGAINAKDPYGGSYGLFQDNLGSQGAAYRSNPSALLNPLVSARASAPAIRKGYAEGLSYGYSGSALAAYTATHSGHPGYAPRGSILPPKVWPSYTDFANEANAVQSYYQRIVQPGGLAGSLGAIGYGVQIAPDNAPLAASGGSSGTWSGMLQAWNRREAVIQSGQGLWQKFTNIINPVTDVEAVMVLAAEVIVALLLIAFGLMAMLGIGLSDVVGAVGSAGKLAAV